MSIRDYAAFIRQAQCMGCGSYACTVVADVVYTGPSPSKPSSREQRRARKAAKNLYMWRTFGDRRKWNENRFSRSSCGRYPMRCGKNDWILINANDTLYLNGAHGLRNVRHDVLAALREPSGFKAMSRRADEAAFLRDHLAEFNRLSMSTLFDEAKP